MKINYSYIIIAILVLIIISLFKCGKVGDNIITKTDTLTKVLYIHDTIKITGKTKINPSSHIRYVHDTIIDSTGKVTIFEHKKYTTLDTFKYQTDSFTVTFYTQIYSNCPLDSIDNDLLADVRHKIVEKTITNEVVRKKALYLGPSFGLIGNNSNFLSLDGLFVKDGKIISKLGIGFTNEMKPVITAGVYFIISK